MRHEKTTSRITGDVECSCGFFYCEEEDSPEPGDYVLAPCGRLGSETAVVIAEGKHLGRFPGDDAALAFVRDHMEQQQFWPDVWTISDHGNAHLITLED